MRFPQRTGGPDGCQRPRVLPAPTPLPAATASRVPAHRPPLCPPTAPVLAEFAPSRRVRTAHGANSARRCELDATGGRGGRDLTTSVTALSGRRNRSDRLPVTEVKRAVP